MEIKKKKVTEKVISRYLRHVLNIIFFFIDKIVWWGRIVFHPKSKLQILFLISKPNSKELNHFDNTPKSDCRTETSLALSVLLYKTQSSTNAQEDEVTYDPMALINRKRCISTDPCGTSDVKSIKSDFARIMTRCFLSNYHFQSTGIHFRQGLGNSVCETTTGERRCQKLCTIKRNYNAY